MDAYVGNRAAGNELAVEASPIGKAVMEMMTSTSYWAGTFTDLLNELDVVADDKTRRLKSWPQTARTLSGILKRLGPNLRALGVDVETDRTSRRRTVTLTRSGTFSCVTSVTSVTTPEKQGSGDDANDAPMTQDDAGMTHGNPRNDADDANDAEIPPESVGPDDHDAVPF